MSGPELADASPAAHASTQDAGGLRIACLDDDVDQLERISSLLRDAGHKVY